MTKKSLAAVVAVMSLLALAGCSGFEDTPTNGSDVDTDLTIALSREPRTVEPCDSQSADIGIVVHGNITESLTKINPNTGKVEPSLAKSWEQVDDQTWTFTLQDGVTFQDGTPLTADAVVTSVKRLLTPKLVCESREQFPTPVTATAVDEHTVKFVTEGLDPILPLRLSFADITAPSTPSDSKTNEPVGTGPYAFGKRIQGDSITLKRYADYWGDKPQATSVKYVYRSEPSVRANMVKTGEADVAMQIAPQDASDDGRTQEFDDDRVLWFRTMTDRAPFNDLRVRQAVQYAMDKDTITSTLMKHAGKPTDQLLPESVNSYIDDYKGPGYDPDKAKKLLAAAKADGVKIDTEFDLVTRPDLITGGDEIMQAVAQNLEDVGFKVNIKSLDTGAWLKLLRAPFPPDAKPTLVAISHDNITGDASFSYPKYIASDGPNSTINDPKIDDLLKRAAVAQGDERAKLYQQASLEEYKNVGAMIPFAKLTSLMTLGKGIEYKANPLTNGSLRVAEITIK